MKQRKFRILAIGDKTWNEGKEDAPQMRVSIQLASESATGLGNNPKGWLTVNADDPRIVVGEYLKYPDSEEFINPADFERHESPMTDANGVPLRNENGSAAMSYNWIEKGSEPTNNALQHNYRAEVAFATATQQLEESKKLLAAAVAGLQPTVEKPAEKAEATE